VGLQGGDGSRRQGYRASAVLRALDRAPLELVALPGGLWASLQGSRDSEGRGSGLEVDVRPQQARQLPGPKPDATAHHDERFEAFAAGSCQ
jgi:hypothetical protein